MTRSKKKNNNSNGAKYLLSLLILAVIGVAAWWLYNKQTPKFIRYAEFGIDMPYTYAIHGIDVSRYQDLIDWSEVKAMKVKGIQIGFAFIKATEGIGNTDPYFKKNWSRSRNAEMPRGAYHFFIASKSGRMQAENFIKNVTLEKGDLPPVLDVEQANGVSADNIKARVQEFLDVVQEYYGVEPIIYTNVDFYNQYLKGDFDKYPLWVAHYLQKDKPRITRSWIFWQHNESGHVNGILNSVDFNVFNGDSTDFKKLLID